MKNYGYKTIKSAVVNGRRVLIRADFNVPVDLKRCIVDDFRIKRTLPTIKYLLDKKAKIILISHLGRPVEKIKIKNQNLKIRIKNKKYSLKFAAKHLEKLLKRKVCFVDDCIGKKVELAVSKMKNGDILMLENLRFYEGEEKNDKKFAASLAALADIYVNDAFGVSHRKHASVCAITEFLPSYAGLLLNEETKLLNKVFISPQKPLCVAVGGGKISTKIGLILRFFEKADHILIGGALANTFLKMKGYSVGRSKIEKDKNSVKNLDLTSVKIHLPIDVVVADNLSEKSKTKIKGIGKIADDEIILDIGPDTVELFNSIIKESKTVIWNGPLGFFEFKKFAKGTIDFAKALYSSKAFVVLGGGDTIAAVSKLNLGKFGFVSTGGGAMLEFLAGKEMPGIKALEIKN